MLEIQRLRPVEREVDRIERVDRGQDGGVGRRIPCDEVADIDAAIGNAAGHRRADRGEFDIELARSNLGLGGGELRLSGADPGAQGIDFLGADRLIRDQAAGPGEFAARQR